MNSFKERVYSIVATIPQGKVATYKQIAKLVGNPKAARAVGMCMAKNKDTEKVPCHQLVSSNGELRNYAFGGIIAKKEKLEKEGVEFKGEKVNLEKSQWKL